MVIYSTITDIKKDKFYLISPYNFLIGEYLTKDMAKVKAMYCIEEGKKRHAYNENLSYYILSGEQILNSNINVTDKI